jgi:hypothetical protein
LSRETEWQKLRRDVARGVMRYEIEEDRTLNDNGSRIHVCLCSSKLQRALVARLRDRVQAVVLANETGLVRPGSTYRSSSRITSLLRSSLRGTPKSRSRRTTAAFPRGYCRKGRRRKR